MGSGTGDKSEGKKDEMKGTLKEKAGGFLGDEDIESEGKTQQTKGEGKQALGDVKDAGDKAKESVKDALK